MTSANSGNRKGKGNKKKFVPLSEFNPTQAVSHSAPPSAILPPGLMPAVAPAVVNGNAVATTQGAAREEEELCFICADAVTWYAVGECNHRVCHLCSLRLRALYKQRTCALCKTELAEVVYTKDGDTVFQDFDLRAMPAHDKKLKIYFDEPEIYEDVMILLRFNCPDPGCDVACAGGWRELKDHVRKAHGMLMCELCTRHKKLFTHEHTLYTRATLDRHNKLGDPDDPSFKGHPQCGFCKIHFYSQDELYEHCREKHEQCFLCQRNGIRNQYYQNYAEMEVHFQNDHFPCYHPECLEKKFVVFDSDIDLKAHELEVHRDQKARAKGQQIEVNFTYASRGWDSDHGRRSSRRDKRGGRSDGRADGRPSDGPNRRNGGESRGSADASVPPQPILLPQAVPAPAPAPSDGVRRLRPPPGFGSQLSDAEPATQGRSRSDSASPPISPATIDRQHPRSAHVKAHPTPAEAASGVSKTNGISSGIDSASNADPELTAKLQTLFNSDVSKLGEFRSFAASFRQGHLSADEFLEGFMTLVLQGKTGKVAKNAENEAGKAWRRLAESVPDTVPDEVDLGPLAAYNKSKGKRKGPVPTIGSTAQNEKRNEMLRAWNDWKVKVKGNLLPSKWSDIGFTQIPSALQANDVPAPSKPSTPSYASSAATPSSVLPDTRTSAPSSARVLVIKNNASKQRFSRGGWGSNSLRNPTEKQETVWERVARNIHERDQAAGSNLLDDAEKQTPVTFAHLASGGQQQQQGSSSDSESKPSIAPPPRPSFATTASQPNRPHSRAVGGVGARIANKDEFPGLPTRAPRPALSRPINGRIGGQAWGSESEDGQSGEKNEERGRKGKKGKTVLMHFG